MQAEGLPSWHNGAPVDSHGRFTNLDGSTPSKRFADFLRWQLIDAPRARRATRGEQPAPRVPNDGKALRADTSRTTITWIGHSTTLIQLGGLNILTDPNFSEKLGLFTRRRVPPGVALSDLPPIDAVIISHNHYDHMDRETIDKLAPSVMFLVPKGLKAWLQGIHRENCVDLDWGQMKEVKGVRFYLLPSQHWSRRGLLDTNKTLWGSWLIETGTTKIYFAGDSGYFAGFTEIRKFFPGITVALLPIGAYEPRWFMKDFHMNPEEAVQAFQDLGAGLLIPIHWGTFKVTDEPLDEPPRRLLKGAGDAGISQDRIRILKIGETLTLP